MSTHGIASEDHRLTVLAFFRSVLKFVLCSDCVVIVHKRLLQCCSLSIYSLSTYLLFNFTQEATVVARCIIRTVQTQTLLFVYKNLLCWCCLVTCGYTPKACRELMHDICSWNTSCCIEAKQNDADHMCTWFIISWAWLQCCSSSELPEDSLVC